MNFDDIHERVPLGGDGELHATTIDIFPSYVRIKHPGKHKDSLGDFVVEVRQGPEHDWWQIKHADLFADIASKHAVAPHATVEYLTHVAAVCQGNRDVTDELPESSLDLPGIDPLVLLWTLLTLAVCEHRRRPKGDTRGGGRYLHINFLLHIAAGAWTIEHATEQMREGFRAFDKSARLYRHATIPERYSPLPKD